MSSSEDAYQQLAQVFSTRSNRILEIEILPPALGPFLQDGYSIGITKKYLVQAFVAARRIFFKDLSSTTSQDENAIENISVSSEIILLFDCEHLTACNWRKRRLVTLIQSHDLDNAGNEALLQILETELSLMTTYLCSPLHRHTKSPTLWQHRLWVLNQILKLRKSGLVHRAPQSLSLANQALWKAELTIVLRAGELHPRNYYAFSYMRQLHDVLSDTESAYSSAQLARSVTDPTLDWCLTHLRDISGWMFLLYLLKAIPDRDIHVNTINKVVGFALHVRWEGESLWTFVDLAARAFDVGDSVTDTMCIARGSTSQASVLVDEAERQAKPWMVWLVKARVSWVACELTSNHHKTGGVT